MVPQTSGERDNAQARLRAVISGTRTSLCPLVIITLTPVFLGEAAERIPCQRLKWGDGGADSASPWLFNFIYSCVFFIFLLLFLFANFRLERWEKSGGERGTSRNSEGAETDKKATSCLERGGQKRPLAMRRNADQTKDSVMQTASKGKKSGLRMEG